MSTLLDYLEERVDFFGPGGCWLWLAGIKPAGYGSGCHREGSTPSGTFNAHREVYRVLVGEPPEGLDLDHLCEIKSCVNPAHLVPSTRAANIMRTRPETCPAGHPYDKRRGKYRGCSTCDKATMKRANAKRRAAA